MVPRALSLALVVLVAVSATSCADTRDWDGWRDWVGTPADPSDPGPYAAGSVEVWVTNPETGNELATVVWFPERNGAVDRTGSPHPGIVFVHGFLANPLLYPGNGQQLASWGYVVAMPDLPDVRLSVRVSDARYLLTYLVKESASKDTLLAGMVDSGRLGMIGHSLGGLTTLAAAARDERIKAAVALDPVNPPVFLGMSAWDAEVEGAEVTAPTLVMGAPAQTCNYFASYESMFPLLGAQHRAKLVVTGAHHCDFMQLGESGPRDACYQICGGEYDEGRVGVAGRYAVAWLNYYLLGEADFYRYLYGGVARDDAEAGLLIAEFNSAPPDVLAMAAGGGIRLSWTAYDHASVAGYNVYRRTAREAYGARPLQTANRVSAISDADVAEGVRYFYVVRSRDASGNEHQASVEVSAVASGG
jgi:predicted dienelactone hydrolase